MLDSENNANEEKPLLVVGDSFAAIFDMFRVNQTLAT